MPESPPPRLPATLATVQIRPPARMCLAASRTHRNVPIDVDVVDVPERARGQLGERRRVGDPGRRRERVEPAAERGQRRVEQRDHRRLVGDVDLEGVAVDLVATSCAPTWSRSATATRKPSRCSSSQTARPIPLAPPVTIAVGAPPQIQRLDHSSTPGSAHARGEGGQEARRGRAVDEAVVEGRARRSASRRGDQRAVDDRGALASRRRCRGSRSAAGQAAARRARCPAARRSRARTTRRRRRRAPSVPARAAPASRTISAWIAASERVSALAHDRDDQAVRRVGGDADVDALERRAGGRVGAKLGVLAQQPRERVAPRTPSSRNRRARCINACTASTRAAVSTCGSGSRPTSVILR